MKQGKGWQSFPRECPGHSKHPLPTTQEKTLRMGITRWSTPKPDWLYSLQPKMEKLYTVSKNKTGADCGSDQQLLIAKFRLKLKKVGKTTRSFKYDWNQIPYNYTVEVTHRFKGLDMIECLKNYGWRFLTLYKRQWSKPSPRKKKCSKSTWLSEEALQIAEKRRKVKSRGEKERYTHLNAEFKRIARRDKKALRKMAMMTLYARQQKRHRCV